MINLMVIVLSALIGARLYDLVHSQTTTERAENLMILVCYVLLLTILITIQVKSL